MSKRTENNFTKAVNELLGYQSTNKGDEIPEDISAAVPEDAGSQDASIPDGMGGTAYDQSWAQPEFTGNFQPFNVPDAESVIASNMEVNGDITTKSDLLVSGKVTGDIKCDGNLEVNGSVDGDISAAMLVVRGTVIGNIEAAKSVEVQNGAKVKGDILAQAIIIAGISEGDLKAENSVELRNTAVIEGNIYSNKFDVQNGAKLKGMIHTFE